MPLCGAAEFAVRSAPLSEGQRQYASAVMVPRPALGSMPAADQRVGVGALILDIPCQSEDGNFDRLTVVRAPPNTSERPGGHVATVERPPTPRSLTRDCTTMGGGPSPQYAVAVRIVPSGYGKLAPSCIEDEKGAVRHCDSFDLSGKPDRGQRALGIQMESDSRCA